MMAPMGRLGTGPGYRQWRAVPGVRHPVLEPIDLHQLRAGSTLCSRVDLGYDEIISIGAATACSRAVGTTHRPAARSRKVQTAPKDRLWRGHITDVLDEGLERDGNLFLHTCRGCSMTVAGFCELFSICRDELTGQSLSIASHLRPQQLHPARPDAGIENRPRL